ncbi:thioredoxin TrxC [Nitrosomonas sp.]|uniref:thioredoxin TrxC n=1 Tax=Nitrosomonas sp. TaxID=42353 RepID=UPI00208BD13F|nr:thioredoxin TrxC [Nitrosomonas sp.]GJL74907.1 MAG: thiol reductase thioredoxin [Nitrosomonas sp.]
MTESALLVCPHCNAVNRVPSARLDEGPKCGKCHQLLFDGQPVELTATSFQKHIDKSDIPVMVDFWAPWCGPCKMMAPQFAQAAAQLEPKVRLAKVNTDTEQTLGEKFGIRSIPTLVLFRQGREIARQPGAMNTAEIVRWALSKISR